MYRRIDFFAREYRWSYAEILELTDKDTEMLYDVIKSRRGRENEGASSTTTTPNKPTYSR